MIRTPETLLEDRYRILRRIAEGATTAYYEAREQRIGTRVAIKQLRQPDNSDATSLTPAQREQWHTQVGQRVRLLADIRHPALPNVHDYIVNEQGQWIVTQYIPGDDLETLIERRGSHAALDDILGWLDQLLDALAYLHEQAQPPFVHQDIKPGNIRFDARGQIVLVDIGFLQEHHALFPHSQDAYTAPSPYMAPEQWTAIASPPAPLSQGERGVAQIPSPPAPLPQGERGVAHFNHQSDIYALGATIYYLLTATPPPDSKQRLAAQEQGQPDPTRPIHTVNPLVPATLGRIIQQAMALSREDRIPNSTAMRQALQRVVGTSAILPHAPQTIIVATDDTGHYRTIGEAIREARPGARILVRPGRYVEALLIDRPLEMIGDGIATDIVIESFEAPCIRYRQPMHWYAACRSMVVRHYARKMTSTTVRCT
ncbi:MAG: protein kinase [Chloroflexaceae bacterium]|nr:protein kinase [Chloroflexaceae bacterium]